MKRIAWCEEFLSRHAERVLRKAVETDRVRLVKATRHDRLSDLHMIVLSWINFHPGRTPEDIARGSGPRRTWTRLPNSVRMHGRRVHRTDERTAQVPGARTAAGAHADEIERVLADHMASAFIEPVTRHRGSETGTDPSWG